MVPVNFSVSPQGNATWVILAGGDRGRYYLLSEEKRISPKYILGLVSAITMISLYLEFKGYSAVPD